MSLSITIHLPLIEVGDYLLNFSYTKVKFEVKQMKLIDVFNMMVERKIKKGTTLIIVTPSGKEFEYEYDNWAFVDDYARGISYMLDIDFETLQYEVRLGQ